MLKTNFGKYAGRALSSTPNLGVDYFCGAKRAKKAKLLAERFSKLKKRGSRLRALEKTGAPLKKLYVS
eukprot:8662032-Pyramimonas_sp.AAC.1